MSDPGKATGGPSADGEMARSKVNGGICVNVSPQPGNLLCDLGRGRKERNPANPGNRVMPGSPWCDSAVWHIVTNTED